MMCLSHSINVIRDLCTMERKSLSHRARKPKIDTVHILITICSLVAIAMYTLSSVATAASIVGLYSITLNIPNANACLITPTVVSLSWQCAKCGLYLLFLLRLHTIYKDSVYRYSKRKLLVCAVITICINCSIAVCIVMFSKADGPRQYDIADIAIMCSLDIPDWLLYYAGAYDVVMNCLCLYAFIAPLKKLQLVRSTETRSRHATRLSFVATKFVIVTSVAVLSTLIMLATVAFTGAFIIAAYDMLINTICILLMLPYYRDDVYYEKLCCCCIKMIKCCLHQNPMKMKSDPENNQFEEVVTVPSTKMQRVATTSKE